MKNSQIFLGGGGDVEDSLAIDTEYFSALMDGARILYIPVAMENGGVAYEMAFDWFSGVLSRHSRDKDIDFSMLTDDGQLPDLSLYDALYLGGGNTYRLLEYLNRSGLARLFPQYLSNGGLIYGGSAGAMVLGKDIRTAVEENDMNYSNHLGLNLLGGLAIVCHYTPQIDQKMQELSLRLDTSILALPENGGAMFDSAGHSIKTIGKTYLFDQEGKKVPEVSDSFGEGLVIQHKHGKETKN